MSRVVLISGGTRGLGQALVTDFLADPDYVVATFGRTPSSFVSELAADPALAGRFFFAPVDITDRTAVDDFLRWLHDRCGPVSILVNNAGMAQDGVLALQPDDAIERLLAVNLRGTVHLTKRCIRHMLPGRWGRIVNITSIVGLSGFRGLAVYSLTKAGLDGLTRSLARELGSVQITVNSVAPGFLETEMTHGLTDEQRQQIIRRTPLGRLGTPADVTPLVRFLCSDAAAFVTGQTIVVDGGATV